MKTVLTIAGSDCSGGAGIQADLKTMTVHGVYGMSAITALTAQNTTGVRSIMEVSPEFLEEQLDSVFEDIFPHSVKIGMVSSEALINVIAKKLIYHKATNIVLDPVMIATSGSSLLQKEAISALKENLLPICTLVTPNIPEAEVLSQMTIKTKSDMIKASKIICDTYGCSVLLKGGHRISDADDLFYTKNKIVWILGKHIDNPNTHGTGCTLSSAIASNLAKGIDVETSVKKAKEYITKAISMNLNLGKGSGPLNHMI